METKKKKTKFQGHFKKRSGLIALISFLDDTNDCEEERWFNYVPKIREE